MNADGIAQRRLVNLHPERISNVAGSEFPGHFPGEDNSWDLQKFNSNLKVEIQNLNKSAMQFDLVGVDSSIANSLRRIIIAEVPTVAIQHVYIFNNTSVVQDEVLSHRLGLVPIQVNPDHIKWKGKDDPPSDQNTVVFNLSVKCTRNPNVSKLETDPEVLFINEKVLSGDLKWEPAGDQELIFGDNPPKPVLENIILTKLRPGQEVSAQMHCIKGIGQDHACFSPVCTASYRLMPVIRFKSHIPAEHHQKLIKCFAPGVLEIQNGQPVVISARKDTVSREVLRHDEFKDKVELARIRDHFIFSVESAGAIPPEKIFSESIRVMINKIKAVRDSLTRLEMGGRDSLGDTGEQESSNNNVTTGDEDVAMP